MEIINNKIIGVIGDYNVIKKHFNLDLTINDNSADQFNMVYKDYLKQKYKYNLYGLISESNIHSRLFRFQVMSTYLLMKNYKTFFFENPIQHLDLKSTNKFVLLLQTLKREFKKTVVILTKDTDFILKYTDYLYFIDKSININEGKPLELLRDKKKLKQMGIIQPNVINFSQLVLYKKNIKLGYRTCIDDLIKDIYRNK